MWGTSRQAGPICSSVLLGLPLSCHRLCDVCPQRTPSIVDTPNSGHLTVNTPHNRHPHNRCPYSGHPTVDIAYVCSLAPLVAPITPTSIRTTSPPAYLN